MCVYTCVCVCALDNFGDDTCMSTDDKKDEMRKRMKRGLLICLQMKRPIFLAITGGCYGLSSELIEEARDGIHSNLLYDLQERTSLEDKNTSLSPLLPCLVLFFFICSQLRDGVPLSYRVGSIR